MMSISDRINNKRQQKLRESRQNLAEKTGIVFSQELTAEKDGFPFMKYLINALILFCADFGSLYCVITAFEVDLSPGPLVLTCVFFSLALSFMYVNRRLKIITYLAILAGFLIIIFRYYTLVNSGVNALWNSVILFTDSQMKLPYLREFTVYYSDTYTAMSVAICVMAVGLMIPQNIMVSEKMSFRGLFFFSFPIAQFGMYFNFRSSKVGMFLVAVSWVLVEVISFTGGYDGLTDKFAVSSSIVKHRHIYSFKTDARNISGIAMIWLLLTIGITALVFAVVPSDSFNINIPLRDVRQETYRVAKNILSYGPGSLFSLDREANAPGKLSNVNSVSYDGLTDLEVEMVNYRTNRVYLRSYTGYYYDSNNMRWFNPPGQSDLEKSFDLTYRLLEKDYNSSKAVTQSRHKIGIKAADPKVANGGLNVPYYTTLSSQSGVRYTGPGSAESAGGSKGDMVYYDVYTIDDVKDGYNLLEKNAGDKEFYNKYSQVLDEMYSDARDHALYVPDKVLPAVEQFCEEYGIKQSDSIDKKIEKVTEAFRDDFEYTLRPGKVPQNEDYIYYFLVANRRGYCQHFATSAVMIFRYLGIPARYAEGYAIDRDDFFTSEAVPVNDFSEWITSPYRTDTNVSRLYIPDSNGHAWVEIFREGFGWDATEVTMALSVDEGRSFLGALLSRSQSGNTSGAAEMINNLNLNRTAARLILLLFIILAILAFIYLARMFASALPRHIAFARGDGREKLAARYRHLYSSYQYASDDSRVLSYREFFTQRGDPGFADKLEQSIFSAGNTGDDEIKSMCDEMNACRKEIIRSMPPVRRIKYYLVDFMW